MRTLQRNKREIYLCSHYIDKDTGLILYKEPVKVKINYEPTSSSAQIMTFGKTYAQNMQAIVDIKKAEIFKKNDRCYITKEPPKVHDKLCNDAEYSIDVLPLRTLNQVKILFVRLTGSDNEYYEETEF